MSLVDTAVDEELVERRDVSDTDGHHEAASASAFADSASSTPVV